jgi:CheY-like chemotaxis protein
MAAKMILIVDDDLAFTRFLVDVLTGAGYQTSVAKHGAAAFLDLESVHPDLMIVDVFMPVIDGITFCRLAYANPATRSTPIIVMSATPQLQATIPVPIAGFLSKPLDIDALLGLVAALIAVPVADEQAGAC